MDSKSSERSLVIALLDAYARSAECQLATYEGLLCLKRSTQSDLRRHRSLCVSMLDMLTSVEAGTYSGEPVNVAALIDNRHGRVQGFLAQDKCADLWLSGR